MTTANGEVQPNSAIQTAAVTGVDFDAVVELVKKTVTQNSAAVYATTYNGWQRWCDAIQVDYLDLTPGNVWQFLDDGDTTKTTRQRQLSAMRKFTEVLAVLDGEPAERLYKGLKLLKAPAPDIDTGHERNTHALSPAQVDTVLRYWLPDCDGDLVAIRNHAMLAVLLFTGLRRAELVALRWADINVDTGVIHVRHGKRDKARDVTLVGRVAKEALKNWKAVQSRHGGEREFVFCALRKGNKLGADRPMSTRAVNKVIDATGDATGVDMTPHTTRRTFITEALATGASIQSVQAQAGHSRGDTTLGYAQAVDAERRHGEFRGLRYGA